MKATVIKTKGIVDNPTMLIGGVVINNPTGEPFWSADNKGIEVFARDPLLDGESFEDFADRHIFECRVFNGELYVSDGSVPLASYKTEIINGKIVKYYRTRVYSGTYPVGGKEYGYRVLHGTGERVDVLSEDYDVNIQGTATSGYTSQLRYGEDYLKYGNFDDATIVRWHYGNASTSLFKNNNKIAKVTLSGSSLSMTGTIMDFVACGATVSEMDFYLQRGIQGVASEYLNAIANNVAQGHRLYMFTGDSSIVNDVTSGVEFTVEFDGQGNWITV